MIKLNLSGYVNKVRSASPNGKQVVNISLGVNIGKEKDKKTYQNFDIAFWDKNAANVANLKEKDYVFIPDVLINKIEISEGKYINIRCTGNIVFKGLEKGEIEREEIEEKENLDEVVDLI